MRNREKKKILKNSWTKPQWPVGNIRHLNTCNWSSKWKVQTENWTENIFKEVMTKNFPTTVKTSTYKSWEYRKNIYKQSKCKEITYPGHYKETAQKQRYTEYIFSWKDSLDCVYCIIWVYMTKTVGSSQWNIVQTSGDDSQWEIEKGLIDSSIRGKSKTGN